MIYANGHKLAPIITTPGTYIFINSTAGSTLTCGTQTYTLGVNEYYHSFQVGAGTYTCTASKTDYYDATASVTASVGASQLVTLVPTYLPSEYQQVEYLKTTGTQWLDTGIAGSDDIEVDMELIHNFVVASLTELITPFSQGTSTSTNTIILTHWNNPVRFAYAFAGSYTSQSFLPTITSGTDYDIQANKTGITINGTSYSYSGGSISTNNIILAKHVWTSTLASTTNLIIKSCQIKKNDTLVGNLVPCYKKEGTVAGMYDKVRNVFLQNQGSSSFVLGDEVEDEPILGNAYILINSIAGCTLTCGTQSYTLGSEETNHVFVVTPGTYTCSASKTSYTTKSTSVTVASGVAQVTVKPSLLPTRYQQVEYLQSSGTQYINTGFKTRSTLACDMSYSRNAGVSGLMGIFGGSDSSNNNAMKYYSIVESSSFNWRFNATSIRNGIDAEDATVHTIQTDNTGITRDGVTVSMAISAFASNVPVYLFGLISAGTMYYLNGKIYYFKISENNTLVGNFVPCYDTENSNKPGMYDTVTNTFFTNQGSGTDFTVGPDVED